MAGNSPQPSEAVGTHRCPNCGSPVDLRLGAETLTATCGACGSELDTSGAEWRVLRTVSNFKPPKLVLPLGTRGTLYGHEWEVVGWVERFNKAYPEYPWSEYLLFNPWQGYRWLVLSNGHWSFVSPVQGLPSMNKAGRLSFEGEAYRPFLGGTLYVRRIWGEFYWRLKVGDKAWGEDFIAPPYILTLERTAEDLSWGRGEYVEPKTIKEAFKVEYLPIPTGVAANQVNPWPKRVRFFWLASLVWVVLLLAVQLLLPVINPPHSVPITKSLIENTYEVLYTSPRFTIPRDNGNVMLEMEVENFDKYYDLHVQAILVNTSTQLRYYTPLHLFGGEMQTNPHTGRPIAQWYHQDIPGGEYLVEYNCYTLYDKPFTLKMRAVRDEPRWDNFIYLVCLIPIFGVFFWIRKSQFEKKRWTESDVSPLKSPPNFDHF